MDCPICLSSPDQPITLSCCKNVYCMKCIREWNQVRNVCPLCCTVSGGQEEKNELKNGAVGEEFDDGSLMLDTEVKEILARVGNVQDRIGCRREQFKNYKSAVPASLMSYLQKQSQRMQIYRGCMQQQYLLQNRASTVEFMQLLAETIINVQTSLLTNCAIDDQDGDDNEYDYDYEMEDEEYVEDSMQDYMQYDEYEEMIDKKASYAKVRKGKVGGQQGVAEGAVKGGVKLA